MNESLADLFGKVRIVYCLCSVRSDIHNMVPKLEYVVG